MSWCLRDNIYIYARFTYLCALFMWFYMCCMTHGSAMTFLCQWNDYYYYCIWIGCMLAFSCFPGCVQCGCLSLKLVDYVGRTMSDNLTAEAVLQTVRQTFNLCSHFNVAFDSHDMCSTYWVCAGRPPCSRYANFSQCTYWITASGLCMRRT